MERDDVKETLETVDGLGDLNLLGLTGLELFVPGVADNDGLASTSDNYRMLANIQQRRWAGDIPCW